MHVARLTQGYTNVAMTFTRTMVGSPSGCRFAVTDMTACLACWLRPHCSKEDTTYIGVSKAEQDIFDVLVVLVRREASQALRPNGHF